MNYKSILLPTFDVQAIRAGRKTQTRRVIKPQPDNEGYLPATTNTGEPTKLYVHDRGLAPYRSGDVLWVRETWMPETEQGIPTGGYIYKATNKPEQDGDYPLKWRPSTHMPRDAARLFLRVTDVRAERLLDISEEDAKAEGVIANDAVKVSSYTWWFHQLWDELNAKRGYGWDTNPWIWVYTFERIEKPEGWPT